MNNLENNNYTIKRAVIYARFSSDMQREESIEAQIRACREYAAKNRMEIMGEYIDRAKSATTDQRPEFLQMIKDSEERNFDVVLVHKLDRFSRNRYDSAGYRKNLKRNGIQLVSVLENYDPDSPEGSLLESVIDGVNEFYSRNLAREVEKGKRENALKGMHCGGRPPLGYDVDKESMMLVINEHEAGAVRLIFELYLDGVGYTEIIDTLKRKGYKTKIGNQFTKTSLYSILHNEKYTGVYVYSKSAPKDVDGKRNGHKYKDEEDIIRVEGTVPIIISKEDFQAAQERLEKRKKGGASHRAKRVYLLSGKVVCGHCGSAYTGNTRPARAGHPEYVGYRCNNRTKRPRCPGWEIRREELESIVLGELANLVFNDSIIPYLASCYEEYMQRQGGMGNNQCEQIEKEVAAIQKDIDNLVSVVMKTASDTLVCKINELEKEKQELQKRLNQLQAKAKDKRMSEGELRYSFLQAREMLKSGTLSTVKKLVERYVKQVKITGDEIEVMLDFPPGGDNPDPVEDKSKQKETPQLPSKDIAVPASNQLTPLVGFGGEGGI